MDLDELVQGDGLSRSNMASGSFARGRDSINAYAAKVIVGIASIKAGNHDHHLHVVKLHNTGPTNAKTLIDEHFMVTVQLSAARQAHY